MLFCRGALLALCLLLCGCGQVPVTSLIKLARIDFQNTDPAQLRVAIQLPPVLRPLPRGITLRIAVKFGRSQESQKQESQKQESQRQESQEEVRDFMLRELPTPAELARQIASDTRVYAYRLEDADVVRLTAFRTELLARKSAGQMGGISISVVPRACKTAELPDGPIYFTAYLRTAETVDYVTLARDLDLRSLIPEHVMADEVPRCQT
jgi:hypothetical protein